MERRENSTVSTEREQIYCELLGLELRLAEMAEEINGQSRK